MESHHLSVIENPKFKHNHKYTEWLARQNGTSWKEKLCDDIDRIILMDSVKTIADLIEGLIRCGYAVRHGKYLSVKPAYFENRKPVRTLNLGDGYGLEELEYRIKNKDREMSFDKILSYEGIQREYALCLRCLQIRFNRKEKFFRKTSYGELRRTSDLLCFMSENNIHSREDFENVVNKVAEESDKVIKRYKAIQKKIADYKFVIEHEQHYLELLKQRPLLSKHIAELATLNLVKDSGVRTQDDLDKFPIELKNANAELADMEEEYKNTVAKKKEVTVNYRAMLEVFETDYDKMVKAEKAELEKYRDNLPKPEQPKVSFEQRVMEMRRWADLAIAKAAERDRLEQQRKSNRDRGGWSR